MMEKKFFDFLETYIYYTSCIFLLQKLKKNVQANFLMGLIFRTSWRVAPTKKNPLWGSGFLQFWVPKYMNYYRRIHGKILRFFLKDFQPNLEVFAKIEIFTLFVWLDF